jgi:ATP-dependent DNA helicase RecQ
VPFLAVTASATDAVAEDIMTQLRFADGVLLRSPFARPNLSYSVRRVEDKNQQLMRIIDNVRGAGIVYVRTREGVEQLAATLTEQGVPATYYHGGMEAAERTIRQEEWTGGKKRVMVATNAFGMGIDKADVRFVVHYSICDSVENYYQETGRAGRDGQRAYAVLLTAPDDRNRAQNRFATEYPSLEQIKTIYESIFQYLQVAVGEGREYSFDFNVYEFCRAYRLFSWTVLNAIKILQSNGYVTLTDESDHPARVMFTVSRDDLYRLRVERDDLDHFLRVLLRMYNGLFTEFRSVSEQEIATVSGYTLERVKEFFKTLWQLRVIRYIPSRRTPLIFFPVERLPIEDVYIAPATYKIRKELAAGRSEQMFTYAENTTECRSVWIQRYFGEREPHDCGVCDICLEKRRESKVAVSPEAILRLLAGGGMTVKQIVAGFEASPEDVIEVIDALVAEGKISVSETGVLRKNH